MFSSLSEAFHKRILFFTIRTDSYGLNYGRDSSRTRIYYYHITNVDRKKWANNKEAETHKFQFIVLFVRQCLLPSLLLRTPYFRLETNLSPSLSALAARSIERRARMPLVAHIRIGLFRTHSGEFIRNLSPLLFVLGKVPHSNCQFLPTINQNCMHKRIECARFSFAKNM